MRIYGVELFRLKGKVRLATVRVFNNEIPTKVYSFQSVRRLLLHHIETTSLSPRPRVETSTLQVSHGIAYPKA